jgi:RimJ/RimL family protein N-acetyltransferase
MPKRINSLTADLVMPCGGKINTERPRSAGVLTSKELAFCRANGNMVSYDPVQIGWVLSTAEDDIDPHLYDNRAGWPKVVRGHVATAPQIKLRDRQYQLRAWSDSDVADFVALLDDPDVWTWLPEAYPAPLTADIAAALIELSNSSNHHKVRAVICNTKIVGQVRLQYDVDPEDTTVAEISYWLGRAHWGKGIGYDMVRMFTSSCLAENPNILSIIARVHKDNVGSRRILEKTGYKVEGANPKDLSWSTLRYHRA